MNIARAVSSPVVCAEPAKERGFRAQSNCRRPRARFGWLAGCLLACFLPLAAQAQPAAPQGFTATAANSAAILQWTQSSDSEITSWEYRYRREPDGWGGWLAVPGATYTTHSHTVTGLINGRTYTFELRSRDSYAAGPTASATVTLVEGPSQGVIIPDAALRAAVAAAVGKDENAITRADLASLTKLETTASIGNLTGLSHARNLTTLRLGGGSVGSLAPLAGLVQLRVLALGSNAVWDLAPLANLALLEELHLPWNRVTALAPLGALQRLETLVLTGNGVEDISPLRALVSLQKLTLARNSIFDLRPLSALTALRDLNLTQNRVSDIAALAANSGLGTGDKVDLRGNPLNADAVETHVPVLRRRGATVIYLPSAPEALEVTGGRAEATLRWARGPVTTDSYEVRYGPGMPPRFGEWMPIEDSTSTTVSHTVRGLSTGLVYTFELRGVGLGGRGPAASVSTTDIGAPNQPPRVIRDIADLQLEVGQRFEAAFSELFADADDATLNYRVRSSNRAVRVSILPNNRLLVVGASAGAATVRVTARDESGASATIEFIVSVGVAVTVADVVAAEGETAVLVLQLTEARDEPTVVPYGISADADPGTADADALDHLGVSGTVTIPAGATSARLSIAIVDDDVAEPAQEVFLVTFRQTAANAGYVLARESATVTIAEGVCDRTPAIRDALRRGAACTAPTVETLAAHTALTLRGRGITALRPGDLQGLRGLQLLDLGSNGLAALPPGSLADLGALTTLTLANNRLATLTAEAMAGARVLEILNLRRNRLANLPTRLFAANSVLRELHLQDNRLAVLPDGLFVGLSRLEEVDLSGNPGTPFVLAVSLARADAAPVVPGPATVSAQVDAGMPFAGRAEVRWQGGGPVLLALPAGEVESVSFVVPAARGAVRLSLTPPALPGTRCGDLLLPCFRGFTLAGSTLALYQPPPRVVRQVPPVELFAADSTRFELSRFFAATDGGPLTYSATSSDPALATASVVGGSLVVEAGEVGDEGSVEITVSAADRAGQSVSLTFAVALQPALGSFMRGWRQGLRTVVPTTQATEPAP